MATVMTPLGGDYDGIEVRTTTPDAPVAAPQQPRGAPAWLAGLGKIGGLGAAEPTLLDQFKATSDTIASVKPFLEFVGNYPMVAFSLVMMAIIGGGALGGYIGAGMRNQADAKKKNPFGLGEDGGDDVKRLKKDLKKLSSQVERLLAQSEGTEA